MREEEPPSILNADLCPLALEAAAFLLNAQADADADAAAAALELVGAIRGLGWVDRPPPRRLAAALDLLTAMGALERPPGSPRDDEFESGGGGDEKVSAVSAASAPLTRWRRLTAHGARLASLPLHPRLGHMVCAAVDLDFDPFAEGAEAEALGKRQLATREGGFDTGDAGDVTGDDTGTTGDEKGGGGGGGGGGTKVVAGRFTREACALAALLSDAGAVRMPPVPAGVMSGGGSGSSADLRRRLALVTADGTPRRDRQRRVGARGGGGGGLAAVRASADEVLRLALRLVPDDAHPRCGRAAELIALGTAAAAAGGGGGGLEGGEGGGLGGDGGERERVGNRAKEEEEEAAEAYTTGALLALAFPDRVAVRQGWVSGAGGASGGPAAGGGSGDGGQHRYTMANGVGAAFRREPGRQGDPLAKRHPWVVVAEQGAPSGAAAGRGGRGGHSRTNRVIYQCAPLANEAQLMAVLEGSGSLITETRTFLSPGDGSVRSRRETRLVPFNDGDDDENENENGENDNGGGGGERGGGRGLQGGGSGLVVRSEPLAVSAEACRVVLGAALADDLEALLGPDQWGRLTQLGYRASLARGTTGGGGGGEKEAGQATDDADEADEADEAGAGLDVAAAPASSSSLASAAWPDWSPGALQATSGAWLVPWLEVAGVVDRKGLRAQLDLEAALLAHWSAQTYAAAAAAAAGGGGGGVGGRRAAGEEEGFGGAAPHELGRRLAEAAPTHVVLPSGGRTALTYRPWPLPPVLRCKLQELFGCAASPRVGGGGGSGGGVGGGGGEASVGTVPVLVELVSPNGRTVVAATDDLASFWASPSGYAAVRAELRGRYPKHPWPKDPTTATPTRLTTKALAQEQQAAGMRGGGEANSAGLGTAADSSRGMKKKRGKRR